MASAPRGKQLNEPASPDLVRAQLERILASPDLSQSESLGRLLTYVVTSKLEGKGDALKEYLIGVHAFGRGDSFDPKTDTIVRVQARRLRAKLTAYYEGPGEADPLVIELPKGSYVPSFGLRQSVVPKLFRRPVPWRLVIPAMVCAAVLGGVLWRAGAPAGAPPSRSIAVLPLENLSKDPAQDYLADGLTEELITELSKTADLRVIARTSVMQYRGKRKSVPEIARELDVDQVIEGSVLALGDKIRITVQLINAARNDHLWAQSYDRSLRDIFAVHSEVAGKIAGAVQSSLGKTATSQRQPLQVDVQAHQLYLQGRFEFNRFDEQSLRASVKSFEEAIRRDPRFAMAYGGLARSYLRLSNFYDPPNVTMPKAREAAKKAIELDGELSEAHVALATVYLYYDWNWDLAESELRRALALNPNSGEARNLLGNLYSALGDNDAARREMRLAQNLDPLSLPLLFDGLMALLNAGKYDEAAQLAAGIARREPHAAPIRSILGLSHMLAGRSSDGLRELQAGFQMEPAPVLALNLSLGHALAGHRSESSRVLARVKETARKQYVCTFEIGSIHAALGENDEAFRWLQQAFKDRCDCMVWLKTEPWLGSIRTDPRYHELIRRVGFARRSN
jgi:TolB-like protein/Flp pilus assembly protein TadD